MMLKGSRNHDFSGEGVILLIDKPLNQTSFEVVKKVRSLFNVRKVGHAGTLDPRATGLLIVCSGRKTKNIAQYVGLEKEYIGKFMLGVRTPSFDTETAITEFKDYSSITDEQIKNAAMCFLGKQQQMPPMYSAIKYGGKPLYHFARAGKTVYRSEREVVISTFDILEICRPYIEFRVICSKGTYIRTLIDELGQLIGCGACLMELRRVRIGNNHIRDAMTIDQLVQWRNNIYKKNQFSNVVCSTI